MQFPKSVTAFLDKAVASMKASISHGDAAYIRVGNVWMTRETFRSLPTDPKELQKRLDELKEKGT